MEEKLLPQNESFQSSQISIALPTNWPDDTKVEYGEKELKSSCQKLLMLYDTELNGVLRL